MREWIEKRSTILLPSFTIYGDITNSQLDELPVGRALHRYRSAITVMSSLISFFLLA